MVYNYVNVFANGNIDGWCWTQPMILGHNELGGHRELFVLAAARRADIRVVWKRWAAPGLPSGTNTITNIPESTHGIQSGAHSSTLQD